MDEAFYSDIRKILETARNKVYRTASFAMAEAYWQIGKSIVEKQNTELGRGFSFVSRQKRITFDDRHFYIDLVFNNYILKCFALIDLKPGDLTHQDLGQMQMYVYYYEREMLHENDNPPIGLILCADKSDAIVRYTLPKSERIFSHQNTDCACQVKKNWHLKYRNNTSHWKTVMIFERSP